MLDLLQSIKTVLDLLQSIKTRRHVTQVLSKHDINSIKTHQLIIALILRLRIFALGLCQSLKTRRHVDLTVKIHA